MIKIRTGLFETNSSSTHTCILAKEDSYEKWINGEYVFIDKEYTDISKVCEDFEKYLIDGMFIKYDIVKDWILPGTDNIPLSTFFDYLLEVDIEDDDIFEKLEDVTEGWPSDTLWEIGIIPYTCFTYYYENIADGGSMDITKNTITVNGLEIPIVACCAMTEN